MILKLKNGQDLQVKLISFKQSITKSSQRLGVFSNLLAMFPHLTVLTSGCRGGCFSRPFSSASLLQSDMMQSNNKQVIIIIFIIVIFVVIVIKVARSVMVFSSTFPRLFQQKCSAHEKWIPWIDNDHIDSFYRRATDTFYSIGEQWISEYLSSTSLQSIALLYLDVPMFRWLYQ